MDFTRNNTNIKKEELWPSVASVFVPLIQLVTVLIVSLSERFQIDNLLVFPELLNLMNLLAIVITITAIGYFWYWRSNINILNLVEASRSSNSKEEQKSRGVQFYQSKIAELMKHLLALSFIFLVVLVVTTIVVYTSHLEIYSMSLGAVQYLSYILFLAFSGLVIYIWIYEYTQNKQKFQREDFTDNLISTLSDYGIIERPDLKILQNRYKEDGGKRELIIEINDKQLGVIASLDGLEIEQVVEIESNSSGE